MIALGICDDVDAAATLVVDGHVVGAFRERDLGGDGSKAQFPARAIEALLGDAGLQASAVDRVIIAGTMTATMARLGRDPVRSHRIPEVRAVLRRTGLHMVDAEVSRRAITRRLVREGLGHTQLIVPEAHLALAQGAYRTQPDPDALVVVAHPAGDGLAVSVWDGEAGQLDQCAAQSERALITQFSTIIASALGQAHWHGDAHRRFDPPPDALRGALRDRLAVGDDPERLATTSLGRPEQPDGPFWVRLIREHPWEQIASAFAWVLAEVLLGFCAHWLKRRPRSTLAVAGDLFSDALLLEALADEARIWCLPGTSTESLALGAVLGELGLAPWLLTPPPAAAPRQIPEGRMGVMLPPCIGHHPLGGAVAIGPVDGGFRVVPLGDLSDSVASGNTAWVAPWGLLRDQVGPYAVAHGAFWEAVTQRGAVGVAPLSVSWGPEINDAEARRILLSQRLDTLVAGTRVIHR